MGVPFRSIGGMYIWRVLHRGKPSFFKSARVVAGACVGTAEWQCILHASDVAYPIKWRANLTSELLSGHTP
jgi:hypothetical protein